MSGIKIGPGYKLTPDGRIIKDERAIEAKLDVSTRLKRRHSKRQRPARKGEAQTKFAAGTGE